LKERGNNIRSLVSKQAAMLLLFFGLVSVLCFSFYKDNIRSFPYKIHAWTQSDRYALALNFQENGFDLFHPQTYNFKTLSQNQGSLVSENRITPADCPMHEYVIALIMKITGNNRPSVFRFYNLLYGLLGFLFLFLWVRNTSSSWLKPFAVLLFAFLSPVYVYYLDGFLPSITSVSNVFIGLYFYFKFLDNKRYRYLFLAVLFTLLAALSRIPFTLFISALFCQRLWIMIKNRKPELKILWTFMGALAIIIGYFFYNIWLARVYGSSFLMTIMPAASMADLRENISYIYHTWFFSYFTLYHYAVILLLGIIFIVQWIRNRTLTVFQKTTGFLFLFTFFGSVIYFFLMVLQFHNHDYYFLDCFYIPCLLYILMCLDSIRLKDLSIKLLFAAFVLVFGYLSYGKCKQDEQFRYGDDPFNRYQNEYLNYLGSSRLLDSLKISPTSRMVVMDAYTTNTPFILMNRTGYTLMGADGEHIKRSLDWNYDYAVMQNEFILSDIVNYYPEIVNELEPIGNNGKITVFKKNHRKKNLQEFLMIKDEILFCKSFCSPSNNSCSKFLSTDISCDSILLLNVDREFNDIVEQDISPFMNKEHSLMFWADCRMNKFNQDNTDLVAVINNDVSGQIYYRRFSLNQYLGEEISMAFRKLYFMYPLPVNGAGKNTLKLYLWNNGKNEIELKNVGVCIY